jgi:hypothetical protein
MNPLRQTLDPEIASVANWADRKILQFIGIFATVERFAQLIKDQQCRQAKENRVVHEGLGARPGYLNILANSANDRNF